jgi:3-phosphoshikimate 1-carboxyvinyltransferase
LLAGLFAEGTTEVTEPKLTRDHTERLLAGMGAAIRTEGLTVAIDGCGGEGPRFKAAAWAVPADFSSAAFWMAAAAAAPGAEVVVEDVGLNPRRTAFLDVLRRMGAQVAVSQEEGASARGWEPRGAVTVRGGVLRGTDVGGGEIPNLIDELPLVAVVAALAQGTTVIRDAAELRVKESDRIATMARLLGALGVFVEERPDGMVVHGGQRIRGGIAADSAGDHRVAMCAAVLGLFADQPVRIVNTACVATSYPSFWTDLARLTE